MSMQIDIHALLPGAGRPWRTWTPWVVVAAVALGANGCATLRGGHSTVVVTPSQSPTASPASAGTPPQPSLAAIIRNQLQLGHYAEGETALRRYLKQHPGDRAAQAMLHQLTVDPRQALGERWRAHVVQPGDSYSTLASRYLGDPNRFLILARYNGSTNPSLLRAGETLHMPLSAGTDAAIAAESSTATTLPTAIVRGTESPAAEARRLQSESVSLLGQGHKDQALARLDQALAIDPRLKPAGAGATALRTQLLDSYHERAIVLYRDQQLDQAIALWDRVLAIAPDYEPAIVYRTRARELKQRLKQY
ncbi:MULTISPECIES: LysM peptidoglycan-binding domain-containing protein [unclassified Rhodanobacter]|uniref:LysM peptidoglycan-binding domain-containing protein n=1 Tax=unclassified Rhodanobacter TaxID=2621553 RepID=UPI001BE04069|nr:MULTISPECIES: LysM peptidoglycan-binding domain-containing protein [unclassified Rhodanobacter]MBT2145330.1 LysM peptidoglycan-binding domain-containing protein [Rhodanobacter sp. LX-99]MBT2149375.1 LysM peptidoglycan-binding domain-containing protein [Rhodanobacter sp. LX-100]